MEGKNNRKWNCRKQSGAVRLYNVMFPVWLLYLFPTSLWLFILPANFLIDSLVLAAAMAVLGYGEKKKVWKKSILRIWLIGFAADLAGAVLITGIYLLATEVFSMDWNLYRPPLEQLLAVPGIILAGVLIYFLNRKFAFRKTGLAPEQIHRLALSLAIFTAPYTMLIPISWIYY